MKIKSTLFALFAAVSLVGAAFAAADTATDSKQAACCAKAEAKGATCEHECCIAAAKEGKNCTKCGGHGDVAKKK